MCVLGLGALMGIGGATAAGATAAAVTSAGALANIGSLIGIVGTLYQGISGAAGYKAQAAEIDAQKTTEAQLNATQDARQRQKMSSAIRQQAAELAARGVQLDSPTAVALGQTAAQELSFDSQAIRSGGMARQQELSGQKRLALANKSQSMMKGIFGAAGSFLTAAPDIWPGLMRERQLA